jgi:hypothetical protein
MGESAVLDRTTILRRGRRLEYFTIIWNYIEVYLRLGLAVARSISLVGFGLDSFVEVRPGPFCYGGCPLMRMCTPENGTRTGR